MPETTGLVQCVRVGDPLSTGDFCFATLVVPKGFIGNTWVNEMEHFILWWSGVTAPWDPDEGTRMTHGWWLSLLREAMANDLSVTITHESNSAIVTSLQVGGPQSRTAVT